MMGEYKNFAALSQKERADKDYTILCRKTCSSLAIVAPHGGGIELGTVDIADAIAGKDHSFYAFKAIKKYGNEKLHISSNRYDEPLGLKISKQADIVISIHGWHVKKERALIGGRQRELKQIIMAALQAAGFKAEISTTKGLLGTRPENICNRCRSKKGVQLELSRGLREQLFNNLDRRILRGKTKLFYTFVDSIREAIRCFDPSPAVAD